MKLGVVTAEITSTHPPNSFGSEDSSLNLLTISRGGYTSIAINVLSYGLLGISTL